MEKLIIACAITGAETTKERQPNLPVSANEQIEATHECFEQGATVVHLHVRDEKGKPSQKLEHFEKVITGIRKVCPIVIQISTGGAVGAPIAERLLPLTLRPDMASLNMGSINFGDEVFQNLPGDIEAFAQKMKELKVIPELEIYDLAMMEYSYQLIKRGLLTGPYHYQFVLGTPQGLTADLFNMAALKTKLPSNSTWALAGIGRFELQAALTAIGHGGHVRVGFEDNVYFSKGVLATSNAQLVKRIADIAKLANRELATISEAKKIIGL